MKPIGPTFGFIESHSADDITRADIATAAGVAPFHMAHAFGMGTGVPVMRSVRARHRSEAARALTQGAPNILTDVLQASYGSREAFTRAFRDQFGLTPESVRAVPMVAYLCWREPISMDAPDRPARQVPRIEDGDAMVIASPGGIIALTR